jgi:proteasome lid subunit RPN8/RPN11
LLKQLTLTPAVSTEVAGAGSKGYPYEICGALIGSFDGDVARVSRIAALPNSAAEPERRRRFVIDPILIVRLERELRGTGEKLVGFYHSHPDHPAAPSPTDMEFFRLWSNTVWLIVPVAGGTPGPARAWWLGPNATEATELEVVVSD